MKASPEELKALAARIAQRNAIQSVKGGKVQRVFKSECPIVIRALEIAAAQIEQGQGQ